MTAIYRIIHDSWTVDQAYQEMKQYDYYSIGGMARSRTTYSNTTANISQLKLLLRPQIRENDPACLKNLRTTDPPMSFGTAAVDEQECLTGTVLQQRNSRLNSVIVIERTL
jgi:hypothetical protein